MRINHHLARYFAGNPGAYRRRDVYAYFIDRYGAGATVRHAQRIKRTLDAIMELVGDGRTPFDLSTREVIRRIKAREKRNLDAATYRQYLRRQYGTDDVDAISAALDEAGHLPSDERKRFWRRFRREHGTSTVPQRSEPQQMELVL